MKSNQKVVAELKKLNKKIDILGTNNRFMIYSSSPLKFIFFNFIAGAFHALGSLFGTVVVAAVIVYFLSRLNIFKPFTDFINNTLPQIKVEQTQSIR